MDRGSRNVRHLLELWGLPAQDPPETDGEEPDPAVDAYLFDGSRRLALLLAGTSTTEDPKAAGEYADRPLDAESEEVARALRILAETTDPLAASGAEDDAFIETVVDQALSEWNAAPTDADDPAVRRQRVEDSVRQAAQALIRAPG